MYYHVYARGVSKQEIFCEAEDFAYFLGLFKRYLSTEIQHDSAGRVFTHLRGEVELLSYCLMPNHFHLQFYQIEAGAITALMRGVMTSYSLYFNRKYDRSGPLFESRYKASMITSDEYLYHISRYIHLNHKNWRRWPWSSYLHYKNKTGPDWLSKDRVLDLFPTLDAYVEFVDDYEDNKRMIDEIKHQLADK